MFISLYILDEDLLSLTKYVWCNNHVSILPIQDLKNKHFNMSAILYAIMTSCKATNFVKNEFPDPISVETKIVILCQLQAKIL